jgi:hypothetical protein
MNEISACDRPRLNWAIKVVLVSGFLGFQSFARYSAGHGRRGACQKKGSENHALKSTRSHAIDSFWTAYELLFPSASRAARTRHLLPRPFSNLTVKHHCRLSGGPSVAGYPMIGSRSYVFEKRPFSGKHAFAPTDCGHPKGLYPAA